LRAKAKEQPELEGLSMKTEESVQPRFDNGCAEA